MSYSWRALSLHGGCVGMGKLDGVHRQSLTDGTRHMATNPGDVRWPMGEIEEAQAATVLPACR
jgi:hypothetical protein